MNTYSEILEQEHSKTAKAYADARKKSQDAKAQLADYEKELSELKQKHDYRTKAETLAYLQTEEYHAKTDIEAMAAAYLIEAICSAFHEKHCAKDSKEPFPGKELAVWLDRHGVSVRDNRYRDCDLYELNLLLQDELDGVYPEEYPETAAEMLHPNGGDPCQFQHTFRDTCGNDSTLYIYIDHKVILDPYGFVKKMMSEFPADKIYAETKKEPASMLRSLPKEIRDDEASLQKLYEELQARFQTK